jgi:hypothetical protein
MENPISLTTDRISRDGKSYQSTDRISRAVWGRGFRIFHGRGAITSRVRRFRTNAASTTCSKHDDLQISRRRRRANRIGGGAARVQSYRAHSLVKKILSVWCRHNPKYPAKRPKVTRVTVAPSVQYPFSIYPGPACVPYPRVSGLRASKRRRARRVAAALVRVALECRLPATGDHTSRDLERPTRRFDGVTKGNALVVSLVLAMHAVADADAGDATTDVVGQENASSRRVPKYSLFPDPAQHSPSRAMALK